MKARFSASVLMLAVLGELPPRAHGAESTSAALRRAVFQSTVTVTGRVVDARTNRPLEAVQVYVEEARTGTTTDRDGRYVLENLPAGEVTLAVQMIGYASRRE